MKTIFLSGYLIKFHCAIFPFHLKLFVDYQYKCYFIKNSSDNSQCKLFEIYITQRKIKKMNVLTRKRAFTQRIFFNHALIYH